MWPNAQGTELIHKRAFPPTSARRQPMPPPLTSLLCPRSQDGTQSACWSERSPVLVARSGLLSLTFKMPVCLQHGSGLRGEASWFLLATVSASRSRELPRALPMGLGLGLPGCWLISLDVLPTTNTLGLPRARGLCVFVIPLPPLTWVKKTDGFRKAKFPQGSLS